jgi:hypothetical protein
MILWIFAFAYGRMTDELNWKPFVILAAVSAITTYLWFPQTALGAPVEFGINYVGFLVLFVLGFAFGRWWNSRKTSDRFSD